MIIIILFRVKNIIEIETHNYLIHVALYKKLQNLKKTCGLKRYFDDSLIKNFWKAFSKKKPM